MRCSGKEIAMNRKVTAILVNYNGYEDTIECVRSLMKATYDNLEIIVVDNGSTKMPTQEQKLYLQEHADYVETHRNLGFSGGNNVGIRRAIEHGADYVLLLNNDTIVTDGFLNPMISAAERTKDVGIVGGKIFFHTKPEVVWYGGGSYDFSNGNAKHWPGGQITDAFTESVQEVSFVTGCLMLIPVSVIERIGFLDETFFLYAEDTEFCCRAIQSGLKLLYCPDAVIYHKVSASTGGTSYATQYYMTRNNLYVAKMYGTNPMKAYCYLCLRSVVRVIKRKQNLYPVLCGWYDFAKNKKGCWERT